jgi:hypothetical protein
MTHIGYANDITRSTPSPSLGEHIDGDPYLESIPVGRLAGDGWMGAEKTLLIEEANTQVNIGWRRQVCVLSLHKR